MVVPCKLSIYSVYDCLSVGRYVRLVGGFFITASKYLRDRTTRRMEDRPSKCEDVANTVSLISLGIYYYLYRLRKVRVAFRHLLRHFISSRTNRTCKSQRVQLQYSTDTHREHREVTCSRIEIINETTRIPVNWRSFYKRMKQRHAIPERERERRGEGGGKRERMQ